MRKYVLFAVAFFLTSSGNAQWRVQNPGFTKDSVGFYEMSLPDQNTAWAVCYDGWFGLLSGRPMLNFTRTLDGGATWMPGKVGTDRTLRFSNISAIDGQEAWVAMHKMDYSTIPILGYVGFGKGGGVFHTADGGASWEHTTPGELFNSNSTPQFVYFKDKNHGIAVGDPNQGFWEIYLTNNKGKKWKRVPSENLPEPLANERGWISGYAAIGNTIWFGTTAGRMYKSMDFGKTWTVHTVTLLPGTEVNEIAFLDDGLTGVAHLRNNTIFRTYVFSTTDGGLTWTNYFQPPNWKNSRMTAVPGTRAFVSTAVHGNPTFRGSAVSYDAGQTWTEIENDANKAACRFFDANTGYAGGLYVTGHPVLGAGGLFKSEIVFQAPSSLKRNGNLTKSAIQKEISITDAMVNVYPIPAKGVLNIAIPNALVSTGSIISIVNMEGKVMETKRSGTSNLIQVDVRQLSSGLYIVRIESGGRTVNKLISVVR
jgi:photosystem II stability/assembly factor-like uncharacterized protein